MSVVGSEVQSLEKRFATLLDAKHIVLALLLAGALFIGVYFYQGRRIAEADGRRAVAEAVAKQAKDDADKSSKDNAALQTQKDQIIATLQTANTTLAAANQKLSDAMKAESLALVNQQSKDKTLPPTELAGRWTLLVPKAKVQATTTGYDIDADGGLATVLELEQVPVLTTELAQSQQALDNANKTIANDATILSSEKDKHTSDVVNDGKQLDAAHKETQKAQADFDDYKKHAKRNIMRAYVAGVVSGLVLKFGKILSSKIQEELTRMTTPLSQDSLER